MLTGIKNLLGWLNENWTVIIIIIGLGVALYEKVKKTPPRLYQRGGRFFVLCGRIFLVFGGYKKL